MLSSWIAKWRTGAIRVSTLRSACRDKDKTPARYQAALRGIDSALFQFANRAQTGERADCNALRDVLVALGKAERSQGASMVPGNREGSQAASLGKALRAALRAVKCLDSRVRHPARQCHHCRCNRVKAE